MTEPTHNRPAQAEDSEGVSILEYLVILLDEWRTVAAVLFLAVVLGGCYLLLAIPSYRSSGTIQVSASDTAADTTLLDWAGVDRRSPVETEVEILRSKRIVSKAVRSLVLNIAKDVPLITFDLRVSLYGKSPTSPQLVAIRQAVKNAGVEDWVERSVPAFIQGGKDRSLEIRLGAEGRSAVVKPGGHFEQQGVSFDLSAQGLAPGEGTAVAFLPDDLIVEQILQNLGVACIISGRKDTNLVRVTYEGPDRRIARDLVNAIMDSYMAFALEWRTLRADRSATFIEGQLAALTRHLESAEKDLQSFIEQQGVVFLPDQAKELIRMSSELDFELRKAQIQEQLLNMVVEDLSAAKRKGKPAALTGDFLVEDNLLAQAIGSLNELELKREALLTDVTELHPTTLRLSDEIQRVQNQILELVKASRDRIGDRRSAISKSLDELQAKLTGFPDKERKMMALRRSVDVTEELYKLLMTKLEESRIVRASTTTDKRIIDKATTSHRCSKPKRMTILAQAALIGLLLGIGAVFARRAIDPRIQDEDEIKALTRLPLYGAIPDFRLVGIAAQDAPILDSIWELPKGPAAEAFRTIRTNVEFAQPGDQPLKVLQITSSEASEGKSTILANLGVALVNAGHKVLIVDLDLRRPSQHRIFGARRTPGISEYLVGRAESPLARVEKYNLDLIAAGSEPPESQRLLSSRRLGELLAEWRERYDYILLDTPPLLVADSLIVSSFSDMVLFVVRPRHCRRTNLRLAESTCMKMKIAKGLIINSVAARRRSGYYHYYRGSYYGSKTSDTQES